ncbi:MAG: hypothetical protein Q7T10_16230 [Rhodoferax sp.]|uniref:hypothetical protein n=1 Tax=Rhodoferax sp. TaxID=50421 RepID=UPI0027176CE3|nr:hypothetical protein [Rhodoferax sp.]MDO8450347.1 hypothetical protein [Rhodoferax sp.]
MRIILTAIFVSALLGACAHNDTVIFTDSKIDAEKVIALDAPRTPWVVEIEARLRKEGFKVMRWSSTTNVQVQTSDARKEQYRESSTRYILSIRGYANSDAMHRCFGGGFNFNELTAELVDTKSNETMFSVTGSGYSENCPPMSGTLFGNITDAVKRAWK